MISKTRRPTREEQAAMAIKMAEFHERWKADASENRHEHHARLAKYWRGQAAKLRQDVG